VFYYSAVLHDLPDSEGNVQLPGDPQEWLEALGALPEMTTESKAAEVERVRSEMEEAARFYWRNSRFNCAMEYDWHIDHEPRLRSEIADTEAPWYRPVDQPAYQGIQEQYDGLMQVMVLYTYNENEDALVRIRGGGGWTWGADLGENHCGWSWWAACTADNVCGSDWLVVHEFGHQLDSLFHESGHPEVWFNHLAPLEGNLARYGEHFDCNSYILRRIPEADWLDLKWGELRTYSDADGDRVPDPDNWLLTLGLETDPNPAATDSDGDGLDDYLEFMAANGNRRGHTERLHPTLILCDPLKPDTDGDGLVDGFDPLPSLPFMHYIPMAGDFPWAEEPRDIPQQTSLVDLVDPAGEMNLSVGLSYLYEESLELYLQWGSTEQNTDRYELQAMLDLENDGWFKGTDNYKLFLNTDGLIKLYRCDAGSPTEWPHDDYEAVDPTAVFIEPISPAEGALTQGLHLTITRELFPELAAKPGENIGFNVGIRKEGWRWYYTLGEPNTLIPLELR
jgi:hypothetical protein